MRRALAVASRRVGTVSLLWKYLASRRVGPTADYLDVSWRFNRRSSSSSIYATRPSQSWSAPARSMQSIGPAARVLDARHMQSEPLERVSPDDRPVLAFMGRCVAFAVMTIKILQGDVRRDLDVPRRAGDFLGNTCAFLVATLGDEIGLVHWPRGGAHREGWRPDKFWWLSATV